MFIFLLTPITYAEDNICILKSGSVVATRAQDIMLYNFFVEFGEKELLEYMFGVYRLGKTKKDTKVIILGVIEDKEGLDIAEVKLKDENTIIWVFYYNIKCNGEKNDKTKRKTPKGQEKKGKDVEERTKRPTFKI